MAQHRLYFYANNQLWRYTSDTHFELIKLPQGFQPHSAFSDGTFIGQFKDTIVLVSEAGEIIYTSDYYVGGKSFQVIGNSQNYIVWQDGGACMQYKLGTNDQYESSLFSLQREKVMNFQLITYDKQSDHFWVYKEPFLYLTQRDGKVLYRNKTFPRVACMDETGNLWIAKFAITILQPQQKKFSRFLYQEKHLANKEDFFRCRGITEKNETLFISTYKGSWVIDLKITKTKRFHIVLTWAL